MGCTEIRRYLADYLEGALLPEQAQQVESHLQSCLACAQECRALEQVPRLLQQWSPPVPSERIWAGIERRLHASRRARPFLARSTLLVASLSAAAVLLVVAFLMWSRSKPAYLPPSGSYARYWEAHHDWAFSGGASELYPYVEAQ